MYCLKQKGFLGEGGGSFILCNFYQKQLVQQKEVKVVITNDLCLRSILLVQILSCLFGSSNLFLGLIKEVSINLESE